MFSFFSKEKVNSVNVNELQEVINDINLIDIREPYEYKSGHLPKAKNVPMDEILSSADNHLDKTKEYHIICQSGGRSTMACEVLKNNGFNVINVSGGTGGYRGNLER
jgi:rhodanese-related sulfurtransferase